MMVTQNFPIKQLSLLENNPRKITKEQFQKLIKSMQDDPDFLWKRPLLVNKVDGKHIVYAGNQRLRAAKKLKWIEIPCIIEQNLSEEIMKSRIIKDNKPIGEFDWDILANDFDINDLMDWGFKPEELVGSVQEVDAIDGEEKNKEEKVRCELCGK